MQAGQTNNGKVQVCVWAGRPGQGEGGEGVIQGSQNRPRGAGQLGTLINSSCQLSFGYAMQYEEHFRICRDQLTGRIFILLYSFNKN